MGAQEPVQADVEILDNLGWGTPKNFVTLLPQNPAPVPLAPIQVDERSVRHLQHAGVQGRAGGVD